MADDASDTGTEEELLLFEERGPVTVMRLNQPRKLNAWNQQMARRAVEYFDSLNQGDYRTRCVVVTGEGRAFCSGGDVSSFPAASSDAPPPFRVHGRSAYNVVRDMRDCTTPIVGAINGYALGLGFALALATDLRIAADDARFAVAQTKRGIMPDFSLAHLLKQAVGQQRAFELIFSGRMIDAQEALDLGLVLEVVPAADLMDRAMELANEIAQGPPLAISASKRVMYMDERHDQELSDWYTAIAIPHLLLSEDGQEGTRSFLEKRDAEFKGR